MSPIWVKLVDRKWVLPYWDIPFPLRFCARGNFMSLYKRHVSGRSQHEPVTVFVGNLADIGTLHALAALIY